VTAIGVRTPGYAKERRERSSEVREDRRNSTLTKTLPYSTPHPTKFDAGLAFSDTQKYYHKASIDMPSR